RGEARRGEHDGQPQQRRTALHGPLAVALEALTKPVPLRSSPRPTPAAPLPPSSPARPVPAARPRAEGDLAPPPRVWGHVRRAPPCPCPRPRSRPWPCPRPPPCPPVPDPRARHWHGGHVVVIKSRSRHPASGTVRSINEVCLTLRYATPPRRMWHPLSLKIEC
ncbi:Myosin-1, partial [Frankliniella fusca]